jgi:hypothetical protein
VAHSPRIEPFPNGSLRLPTYAGKPSSFSADPTTGTWWTGKDSNLRSPQGAADLQSAGFNHSPTRPAKTFGTRNTGLDLLLQQVADVCNKNTNRTRVKRHQPLCFCFQDSLRLAPPQNSSWSWRRELNPRPSDYKSDALPAELRQRRSNRAILAEGAFELQGVLIGHGKSETNLVEMLTVSSPQFPTYLASLL